MKLNFRDMDKRKILTGAALVVLFSFIVIKCFGGGEYTVRPKTGPVVESVYALGTVKTEKQYNVRFGMNTIIKKLYVHEGDVVDAGSPLVMNDSLLVARSPFAGIVTGVSFLEGELAPSGQSIVSLAGTGSMYIKVSLDQDSIILVKKGQEVEISFENMRQEKISGTVGSVYMSDDEFLVRIETSSFPSWVLPGMTCDTAILIRKKENAIMVPSAAITNGHVEIKRKGNRQRVRVESKTVDEKWAEITDGSIYPDDIIYVNEKNKQAASSSDKK